MEAIREFEAKRDARYTKLVNASDYARKKDGVGRYRIDGNDIAISKDGDSYSIYDYGTKTISKDLSESELRAALSEYDTKRDAAKTAEKEKSASKEDTQESGEEIANFIEEVSKMVDKAKRSKRKKKIGRVSKKHAQIINRLMKRINPRFSAEGYELWIDGTGASHIEVRHGKNGKADQSMATHEAKSKIPWVAQNADSGEFIRLEDGTIKRSSRFFNSDGTNAPEIRLKKKTDDGTVYVSECVPDSENKIIWITSAYKNKEGSKGQLLNMEETSSPQPTPEASPDGNATTISIPETEQKSNTFSEKTSENPSGKSVVAEINEYARKHVVGFDKLNAANKAVIRRIIRQGRARGVKESVLIDYANVAARAKIDVVFDKALTAQLAKTKDGEFVAYADAYYDPRNYRIVANPEAQTSDGVLIHELDHALRKSIKGGRVTTKLYGDAIRAVDADKYQEIHNAYAKGKKMSLADKITLTEDEVEAHYARTALEDKGIVHHLVAKQPSVKDKILSFFKKASGDYIGAPNLQKQAMRYYKQYRKWFNEFAKERTFAVMGDATTKVDKGDLRYALPYDTAIEKLENGTLDTTQNTHLRVLEHTPQIYIDKAGASDREIVMSWDVAYLAMNKNGNLLGNYHGLGAEVMRALPTALKDPLYIVKQKNGRIAAVTKIVVKGKRAVFASIELEAYQTTIQEGETVAKKYNLVVTVTDAKPNYLQNTIFSGEIVHNKNSEDPAHFILRLKSLEKAMPTYDLAGSSKDSIPETAEKSNPFDENSSKKSSNFDVEYLAAVESGDMETAQKMVDEAAKAAMPKSQIKMPDGSLRKVYHGTNSGDFTVFNPDYIGMSSGDRGFFGKGFCFAYSKGEAKYYGAKRIISAYLNITNPFDFQRELQTFNGKRAVSGRAPDAVAFLNFAEKFPEIAAKSFVSVYNGENGKDISLVEFAKAYRDVIENKRFEYQTVENEFGEKETLVLADKTVHPYDDNGVTRNYVDYGFQKRFWGDANELDVAYEYLSTVVYDYIDMYSRTRLVLDNNEEFTAKLREMGYDGAIQSADGDEAVAFLPEQIKSADPVTYDDNGNVILLSKRFDPQNPDIRYSLPLTDAKGNPIEYEDVINKGVPYAKSPDMTVGQMRKHIANTTHYKVFSKSQILEDVKRMPMGDLLKAETREQIAEEAT